MTYDQIMTALEPFFKGRATKSPQFVLCAPHPDKSPLRKKGLAGIKVPDWPRPEQSEIAEHAALGGWSGIVPGPSGLIGIDFDHGINFLTPFCREQGIPELTLATPRGEHVYFHAPVATAALDSKFDSPLAKGEVRHKNGYLIVRDLDEIANFMQRPPAAERFNEVLGHLYRETAKIDPTPAQRVFSGSLGAYDSPEMTLGRQIFMCVLKTEPWGWAIARAVNDGIDDETATDIERVAIQAARDRMADAWALVGSDLVDERGRIRDTYAAMVAVAFKSGVCTANQDTIGAIAGLPRETVRDHQRRLDGLGYIALEGQVKSVRWKPRKTFRLRKLAII